MKILTAKKTEITTENIEIRGARLHNLKNISIKISMNAVEQLIKNSIDKSKLEKIYSKSLEQAKESLKNTRV